jgi:hypothetical protein
MKDPSDFKNPSRLISSSLHLPNKLEEISERMIPECEAIKIEKIKKYDSRFRHRIVEPGVNMEGICRNQDCEVFERRVWIPKGYGLIDLSYEINKSACPICREPIESETIRCMGYQNCEIEMKGKQVNPEKMVSFLDV